MPDFIPLLRGVWPVLVVLAIFVLTIKFVQLVMRWWKKI